MENISEAKRLSAAVVNRTLAFAGQPALGYTTGCWLFLRVLGGCYIFALLSWGWQFPGLNGSQGILPAESFLQFISQAAGMQRYLLVPSLAWLNCSDAFLTGLCLTGVLSAWMVFLGWAVGPSLLICYVVYLSLISVSGDFYLFQWDSLLLETGFAALFIAPWNLSPKSLGQQLQFASEHPPGTAALWLLRLVLFKLVFMSGAVKLLSGDHSWQSLTACSYHWETQPLPTPLAWYVWQLPLWFQKLAVVVALSLELLAPWLMFAGRKWKVASGLLLGLLQVLIALTGNYCFFNLLAFSLCFLLLDNSFWIKILPKLSELGKSRSAAVIPAGKTAVVLCLCLLALSVLKMSSSLLPRLPQILVFSRLLDAAERLHIINDYGVFAVMTTKRYEIIVQGSEDGLLWKDYRFRFKPQEPSKAPPVVAPWQPRLDWQMWFAALGSYERSPWFALFMQRLLEGRKEVSDLLSVNPFPTRPPRYVRALLYQYHFSDINTRATSGNWWVRSYVGQYFPAVSLPGY